MPTYHLASCADDVDLQISHIIRAGHLTNTFKHVLIFAAAGAPAPQFAHLPLLVAPDEPSFQAPSRPSRQRDHLPLRWFFRKLSSISYACWVGLRRMMRADGSGGTAGVFTLEGLTARMRW